jgi:oligopeptide transport system ATP-binding protein
MNSSQPLLRVENLSKEFPLNGGFWGGQIASLKAVRNVSFEINAGETLGLVGESGCGKSTLGRCLLRLIEPTSGKVFLKGEDILLKKTEELRALRKKIQIVFQDPFSSLNPRMTVAAILDEPLLLHRPDMTAKDRKDRSLELLQTVGLRSDFYTRYPHEFSGGQRQRIGIARALAVEPELIVCDEPVSALDVSVQAQVINLLMDLQDKFNLTYLFVAHDLKVVKHVSKRVAVMYLGEIVELATSEELYKNPQHPYTKALLSAIPQISDEARPDRIILTGDVPSPISPPSGCHFHPRCPVAMEKCKSEKPPLAPINHSNTHITSCWKSTSNL